MKEELKKQIKEADKLYKKLTKDWVDGNKDFKILQELIDIEIELDKWGEN